MRRAQSVAMLGLLLGVLFVLATLLNNHSFPTGLQVSDENVTSETTPAENQTSPADAPAENLSVADVPEAPPDFGTSDFSTASDIQACGNLNTTNSTLTGNIQAIGTCFNFTQDNSFLDCNGFTITMTLNGSVIYANARNNLTVRNCVIRSNNATRADGINFTNVTNSTIVNNDILISGALKYSSKNIHYGIKLRDTAKNVIANNTVAVLFENTSYSHAIYLHENNSEITIEGNTLTIDGESAEGNTIYLLGVWYYDSDVDEYYIHTSRGVTITNNTMAVYDYDFSNGVDLEEDVDNVTITGNRITTNAQFGNSVNGVYMLDDVSNVTITDNLITIFNPYGSNRGVYTVSGGTTFTIARNNITLESNSSTYGDAGIQVRAPAVIDSNIIHMKQVAYSQGISTSGQNASVTSNAIFTNGSLGIALVINSQSTNVSFNNVVADGDSSVEPPHAISVTDGTRLDGNNFTVAALAGQTDRFVYSTQTGSHIFFNNTRFISDGVFQPFFYLSGTDDLNMTNTSFESNNASIRVIGTLQVPSTLSELLVLNGSTIRAVSNAIFLNSSNASFLNGSAVLTFHNLDGLVNPSAEIDYEGGGTFVTCPVERCTFISYSSSDFMMNVSGFSTYRVINGTANDSGGGGGGGGGGGSGCEDECTLADLSCHGNSAVTCGNNDDDDCLEVIETPCAPTFHCSAGLCLSCAESWVCDDWSSCVNNTQNRTCFDSNFCDTNRTRPETNRSCQPNNGGGGGGHGGGHSNTAEVAPQEVIQQPLLFPEEEEPLFLGIPRISDLKQFALPLGLFASVLALVLWLVMKKHHQKHHRKGKKPWF